MAPPSGSPAGATRATHVRDGIACQHELDAAGRLAFEGLHDRREQLGLPHPLLVAPPGRRVVLQLEHPARRVVGHDEASLRVEHDHALRHPAEQRAEVPAIVRELEDPPAKLLRGGVERPRHFAELIVAVAVRGARQVAAGVAARDRGDSLDATAERRRDEPGDQRRHGHRRQHPCPDEPEHGALLIRDLGQRQGQADVGDGGMVDADDRVEGVVVGGRAVAPEHHLAPGACRLDLGPLRVVLHGRQPGAVLGRVAQHATVRRDQRHAHLCQRAHPVGFLVERFDRERGIAREQLGRQPRLGRQGRLDPLDRQPANPPLQERPGRNGGDDADQEGRQEDLSAEPHGHARCSASL